jgi:hypothetical protein
VSDSTDAEQENARLQAQIAALQAQLQGSGAIAQDHSGDGRRREREEPEPSPAEGVVSGLGRLYGTIPLALDLDFGGAPRIDDLELRGNVP